MGKKPPEGGQDARFFSVDEAWEAQGLPPPTAEEREEIKNKRERENEARRERSEAAARATAEKRRAAEEARAEVVQTLEGALRAADPTAFQRAAVDLAPRFDALTDGQRNALGLKFDAMVSRAAAGTPAELAAMNALGEKLRQWQQSEQQRKLEGTQMFRIPKMETPPEPTPKQPKTFAENLRALLPWGKK